MGLPLFITPVEPEVASKTAEKTASGPRSSIRRRPTIRGPHARLSAEPRRRRMLGLVSDSNSPDEYEVWDSQQRSGSNEADSASVASLQARIAHRIFEEEQQSRIRDTNPFARQVPPNADADGPLMPPVPESRDYAAGMEERTREIQRMRQVRQDLRRMARRHPAPTPPYTDTDLTLIARIGNDSPRPSTLTPALSPLRQLSAGEGDSSNPEFTFSRSYLTDQPDRPTLSERVQAINRASSNMERSMERSRRLMRQARLDGLGDRDRSLSPDGGANAWDTLLTSITPDPQPPSAGSSFASTSASAATSSNSGPVTASISMTSLRTSDSPNLRDCDVSDSGSNPEEEEEEEEDMYELHEYNGSRTRGDRFWRTYAEVATSRADRAARNDGAGDTEHLGGMHRIISRLAERDEIPDSWWASAGLSRNLRREPTN